MDIRLPSSRAAGRTDDPDRLFPARETWRGIQICRVGSTRFGKTAKWRRAADFASFLLNCCVRLARLPRQDVVVALTSPPLISFLGAWFTRLRGGGFCYWVMDMNPDEAIAAGWLRPKSWLAKWLEHLSRFSFKRAAQIIALDHFMRDRITQKGIGADKIAVIPPWSHDGEVQFDVAGRNRFRAAHGLQEKFVVMYSGNHSPCHPLKTVLAAAQQLADDPNIVFCFVGGGSEWRKIVEQQRANPQPPRAKSEVSASPNILNPQSLSSPQPDDCSLRTDPSASPPSTIPSIHPATGIQNPASIPSPNILCLPYQPLDQLAGSLSAADLHLVVMGNPFVGIIHPCKIYNILSVAVPVLYIGPRASHVPEILGAADSSATWARADHGDVEAVVKAIRRMQLLAIDRNADRPAQITRSFTKETLLPRLINLIESSCSQ